VTKGIRGARQINCINPYHRGKGINEKKKKARKTTRCKRSTSKEIANLNTKVRLRKKGHQRKLGTNITRKGQECEGRGGPVGRPKEPAGLIKGGSVEEQKKNIRRSEK